MALLEIDSVFHAYRRETEVLRGVNLSCRTGEIVGVLGRNGSGKSTLLKIIWGMIDATGAGTRVDGRAIPRTQRPRWISYLPQDSCLPRDFSVQRCVAYCVPASVRQSFVDTHPRIPPLLSRRVGNLSGGELRYVELLLVLALGRPFVLLDEPFSRIEPIFVQAIKEELRRECRTRCVLLSDHYYKDVLELCSPVYLLRSGRSKRVENSDDLRDYLPEDADRSSVCRAARRTPHPLPVPGDSEAPRSQ